MYRRRCKGSRGYIFICDRIGRSILGGYQCAGGDVRGAGVTLSVIGYRSEHNWRISMCRRSVRGAGVTLSVIG
jgi:hypothetical protein